MRSAKSAVTDTSSQRRSQPLRQTRTNPPRSSATAARSTGARDETAGDRPIDIFPAITFFADTATALPKELVRHFTLLREVDAKICAPEEQLFELVSAALGTTSTEPHKHGNTTNSTGTNAAAPASVPASAQNSARATPLDNGGAAPPSSTTESLGPDQLLLRRRQLFRQISYKIQEMLVSLEEKNHVIGTANEALDKQIARIEDVWPYLEGEFSDEAKWGSTTHWAYPENRTGKSTHPERARRDGSAAISAAAQALADEAAARSDARKQAVQAKKNLKNNHHDSDFDDHDHRNHKGEGGKKSGSSKARKTAESAGVGLGISSAPNGNPPQKKRKVENTANGAGQGDRAVSTVSGSNASKAKAGSGNDAPGAETTKKRKALPSAGGQSKKKNGATPSATSSPVLPSLPEPKNSVRGSPAPTNPPRPATARARGNSIQSQSDAAKNRPPSAASNKTNGTGPGNGDAPQPNPAPRSGSDARSVKESSAPAKGEAKKDPDRPETSGQAPPATSGGKKETKAEEQERRKSESIPPGGQTPAMVMTKSGRTSKPSTPAMATFQEAARARPSRDGAGSKKAQKKGGGAATAQALGPAVDDEATSGGEGDADMDEPTYCYCNGVSYGEMVACDSDDCEREWFHLACVGLKVAPAENRKWYCEDCKERLKIGAKKGNGR